MKHDPVLLSPHALEIFVSNHVPELREILDNPVYRAAVMVVFHRGAPRPSVVNEPMDVAARRACFLSGMNEFVNGLASLVRPPVSSVVPDDAPWDHLESGDEPTGT